MNYNTGVVRCIQTSHQTTSHVAVWFRLPRPKQPLAMEYIDTLCLAACLCYIITFRMTEALDRSIGVITPLLQTDLEESERCGLSLLFLSQCHIGSELMVAQYMLEQFEWLKHVPLTSDDLRHVLDFARGTEIDLLIDMQC